MADVWQIKKNGVAVLESSIKNCGYTEAQLQSLNRAGYSLFQNGKCVMKGRKKNG